MANGGMALSIQVDLPEPLGDVKLHMRDQGYLSDADEAAGKPFDHIWIEVGENVILFFGSPAVLDQLISGLEEVREELDADT